MPLTKNMSVVGDVDPDARRKWLEVLQQQTRAARAAGGGDLGAATRPAGDRLVGGAWASV